MGATIGIASAQLTLVDSSGNVTTGTTDATGAYEFDNLTAGTYELQAAAPGYTTSVSTLTFPVSSYTVQLAVDGAPPVTPTIVSVAVNGASTIAAGTTTQMTALALFTDGSQKDVTNVATWSSTASAIAVASNTGKVTAYSPGSVTIAAAFDSTTGSIPITVTAP